MLWEKNQNKPYIDKYLGTIANKYVTWSDQNFTLQPDEIFRASKVWKLKLV